jgi:hypothetical protein
MRCGKTHHEKNGADNAAEKYNQPMPRQVGSGQGSVGMLQAYKPPHHLNDAEAEAGTRIEQPGNSPGFFTTPERDRRPFSRPASERVPSKHVYDDR